MEGQSKCHQDCSEHEQGEHDLLKYFYSKVDVDSDAWQLRSVSVINICGFRACISKKIDLFYNLIYLSCIENNYNFSISIPFFSWWMGGVHILLLIKQQKRS